MLVTALWPRGSENDYLRSTGIGCRQEHFLGLQPRSPFYYCVATEFPNAKDDVIGSSGLSVAFASVAAA